MSDDALPTYDEYLNRGASISSIAYQAQTESVQATYSESAPNYWTLLSKRVKDNLSYDGIKFYLKILAPFTVYLLLSHLVLEYAYKEYKTSVFGE